MDHVALLNLVLHKVLSVGVLLQNEWHRPGGPRGGGDKAEVDAEIEERLRRELLGLLNCDFWGEETGHQLTGAEYCWVVDPNDGTQDFLRGHRGSAISVGLLCNAEPVLGAVYAPVTDRGPDCIAWARGQKGILRNGRLLHNNLAAQSLVQGTTVLMSMAASSKPELNARLCFPATVTPVPSIAYRLARVAAGDAVACAALVPVSAHDIVAGHALLLGAGGALVDQAGRSIGYGNYTQLSLSSLRCFGGSVSACQELACRDWDRLFSS